MEILLLQSYNFIYLWAVEDNTTETSGGEDEKKRQKRGGKGMLKTKKKEDVPKLVTVSRAPRGKKKSVTVVTGLSTFVNMKHLFIEIPFKWDNCLIILTKLIETLFVLQT